MTGEECREARGDGRHGRRKSAMRGHLADPRAVRRTGRPRSRGFLRMEPIEATAIGNQETRDCGEGKGAIVWAFASAV